MERILDDEIHDVGFGIKHLVAMAKSLGESPRKRWKTLVESHCRGGIWPPFNDSARLAAGLSRDFYDSLAS
ncbi:DUF455 family protein [Erythrobacter litoralis]|uniref:DUF455 family protein n=1 Tax=Erythrobacter litoralis TaxID=39960 RepID=UPI0002E1E62F|nr:DUF455 family protein [Erythrobacter litoralis]